MSIRLAMATHYFESHRGGVEIVAGQLAREFERLGAAITWLATDATAAPPQAAGCGRAVALRGSNVAERRLGVPYPLPLPSALRSIWREVAQADALLLHDSLYLTNVAALIAARLLGKPVVIVQHIGAVPYRNLALRTLMSLANRWIARPMLARADQVVFISETTARYFSGVRFRRPAELIFNGVDTSIYRPLGDQAERRETRHRLGIPREATVVLFVGRFVEKKGLHILEGLARAAPDMTFAFAGWGPLDPARWGLPNVVVFRDLTGASLASLYRASDILLLPSLGEGLPLVVQEALACGLPVICGAETSRADPECADLLDGIDVGAADIDATVASVRATIQRRLGSVPPTGCAQQRFYYVSRRYDWSRAAAEYLKIVERCIRAGVGAAVEPAATTS